MAFEAGSGAVGGSDDPLQEGLRLVVRGGGIDQAVGDVLALAAAGEGRNVALEQVGSTLRHFVPGTARVRGMTVPVEGFQSGAVAGQRQIGAFVEFAEVVKQGGEGDTAGGVEQVHGKWVARESAQIMPKSMRMQ